MMLLVIRQVTMAGDAGVSVCVSGDVFGDLENGLRLQVKLLLESEEKVREKEQELEKQELRLQARGGGGGERETD